MPRFHFLYLLDLAHHLDKLLMPPVIYALIFIRSAQKLAGTESDAIELLALCYCLYWSTTNNTNQIHAACYKVVGSSPAAANCFLF